MAIRVDFRLLAIKCLTIALTLLVGFGFVEAVLRAFPSLIGLSILARMEPTIRSEIADRLGLPTLEDAIKITPDMRTDGGPTIVLPAANSLTYLYADKVDLDLGAVELVRVDENGLCNDPQKAALKKADILVAGDSFTFCTGVTANNTATHKLEEISGLSVYNLGVRGVGPDEYLEMLKRYAPQFNPRIAIMNVYEGNDLRDVLIKERFVESGGTSKKDPEPSTPAWSYAAQFFKAGAMIAVKYVNREILGNEDRNFRYAAPVGGSMMAMNVANRDQGEVDRAMELRDGKIKVDAFAKSLMDFVAWAKPKGIAPVVTYIPSMYTVYEGTVRFENPEVGSAVQSFSTAQRRWFAANAAAIGFTYLDLTPFFQQAGSAGIITHFPSNVHLTPKGHEIVARHTWEALSKLAPPLTP